MKFLSVAALVLFLALNVYPQQAAVQQAAKAGSLAGTLTKSGSGEPIRNAEISLARADTGVTKLVDPTDDSAPQSQAITVVTDASGRFRFPSLVPGDYMLSVRKNGFHGFRGPNSRSWQDFLSVTIAPGQAVTDYALQMQPGAVITGKVLDEDGEPMAYVQISALKWVYANHRRQLRPIGSAATDDEGSYRIFSLEPGRYVIRANVAAEGGQAKTHYAAAYFPDAAAPTEANPIALRSGDQAQADFRLTRVRAVRVSGHLTGNNGSGQIQIYLRNSQDESAIGSRSGATVDAQGRFTLEGILPGDYTLGAIEFRPDGALPQHAQMPLHVDGSGDIANVSLPMEDTGAAMLMGTLRVDGANLGHPRLDSLRIGLLPAEDTISDGSETGNYSAIGRDGALRIDKISPGKYVVSLTADGSGWEDFYTKHVEIANRDVTDSVISFNASRGVVPINIVVGIDGATVDGSVVDENGKPVANVTVIGVPDPSLRTQFDLYQRGESDANGHFTLRGIKPGSYSFYAWNNLDDESYMDPEFLARFENARTDLTLKPQEHQKVELKMLSTDEP